jgi:hypothetical protein
MTTSLQKGKRRLETKKERKKGINAVIWVQEPTFMCISCPIMFLSLWYGMVIYSGLIFILHMLLIFFIDMSLNILSFFIKFFIALFANFGSGGMSDIHLKSVQHHTWCWTWCWTDDLHVSHLPVQIGSSCSVYRPNITFVQSKNLNI